MEPLRDLFWRTPSTHNMLGEQAASEYYLYLSTRNLHYIPPLANIGQLDATSATLRNFPEQRNLENIGPMANIIGAERTRTEPDVIVQALHAATPQHNHAEPLWSLREFQSASACREFLAYPDPQNSERLAIIGDDWEQVQDNHIQHYVRQLFGALTHPYAQDLPTGVTLSEEAARRYHDGQNAAAKVVDDLLRTVRQKNEAEARCYLLVEGAISLHRDGAPKELYSDHHQDTSTSRHDARKCRLDVTSICSVRLVKLTEILRSNKLVAQDVLYGLNFEKMVRDPSSYRRDKFQYLKSNARRGMKTRATNGVTEDPQRDNKRAVKRTIDEDEDWDGDNAGLQDQRWTRAAKRAKASRGP